MKLRILTILTAAIMAFAFMGCASMGLDAIVKNYNRTCPQDISEGFKLLKVSREPSDICFHINIDEKVFNFDALEADSVSIKEAFVNEFKENVKTDTDAAILVEDCISEKLNIRYEFSGQQSHKVFNVVFDPNVVRE